MVIAAASDASLVKVAVGTAFCSPSCEVSAAPVPVTYVNGVLNSSCDAPGEADRRPWAPLPETIHEAGPSRPLTGAAAAACASAA